ncbi:uncharacterized protein LOC104431850 isoform X2 [Eucalyptus grandis]|uniref:uncharacterized protein LOC104431850 isoform X2 n=1 Tax=Eucalyptus grandis TaxID=71139 RepID=UPI0005270A62|nr:uncharacterized protein LOC104431850 isoform X2 [Eucalyptus grandis]
MLCWNLDQCSLLSTLDSFSGGAFGTNILEVARPERRRRWSRKEVLRYTCYASVRFAIVQVNSSGVMPILFSTSSLPLPRAVACFTVLAALKKAAVALNPGVAVNCYSSLMH